MIFRALLLIVVTNLQCAIAQTPYEALYCAFDTLIPPISESYRNKIVTHTALASFVRVENNTVFRDISLKNLEDWTVLADSYSKNLVDIETAITDALLVVPPLPPDSYRSDLEACAAPARVVVNQRVDVIKEEEDRIRESTEDGCYLDEYFSVYFPADAIDSLMQHYTNVLGDLTTNTEAQDATNAALSCIEGVKSGVGA